MNFRTDFLRKNNTILFFRILAILFSCCGRCASQAGHNTLSEPNPIISIGDTVKGLGDSLWIVFQDKKNNYWFGSNGQGVYHYDGKTIIHFTTDDGLSNDSIRNIQEDKSGNIYFATLGGISKFDGQTFSTLSPVKSNEWKLEPDDLWFTVVEDAGVVYRYDGNLLHRLEFPKTKAGEEFIARFPRSQFPNAKYSPYDVYSIFKDSKGNIWFGTSNLGACRYDGTSFAWFSLNGLEESPVRCIIEDKNGNFWFGNSGQAVYRYDARLNDSVGQGNSLINFREEKGIGNLKGKEKGALVSYMSITEDDNGELWIVTYEAGVWRYDGENVTQYPVNDGEKTITLFSIYKDNQGVLWLGTHESGVYNFNGKTFDKFRP